MEVVAVLAIAMGRTLVLPPKQFLYILSSQSSQKHSFEDFFHLENYTWAALPTTTMHEFVQKFSHGVKAPPPDLLKALSSEDTWAKYQDQKAWVNWLRASATPFPYKREEQFVAFAAEKGKSVNLDDPRMKGFKVRGRKPYQPSLDPKLVSAEVIHFRADEPWRMLTHFYASVYFEDPVTDRFVKRVIRDAFHYKDDLFCRAIPVVQALQKEGKGTYHAAHVRRGDFQFEEAIIGIDKIGEAFAAKFPMGSVVYISTDEKNKNFFQPLRKDYTLRFLEDFPDATRALLESHFGMLEQIIAAQSERFLGTWWSTFTGYITRMRGYAGKGEDSWYLMPAYRNEMQNHEFPEGPAWWREWETCWVGIDEAAVTKD